MPGQSTTPRALLVLGILLSAFSGTPAFAQKKPQGTEEDRRAKAKDHYDKGITHYNLGEFDEAIVEFKAAYELSAEPVLLFNIAQSYRLKEDYKQALYFYRTYLRVEPDAANRADVEKWIAELERLIEEQKRVKEGQPQEPIGPDEPTPTEPSVQPDEPKQENPSVEPSAPVVVDRGGGGKSLKMAGYGTAGVGAVLLVTGVYFGLAASDGWDRVNQASATGGEWTAELQGIYDDAESDELTATLLIVGGSVAVVGGGVLWYLGWRKDRPGDAQVSVAPTKGGAAMVLSWKF